MFDNAMPENNKLTDPLADTAFDLARNGETDKLLSQLEKGLSANASDPDGKSLLMLASFHGNADTSELLLTHGAEVNSASPTGITPLMFAAIANQKEIIDLLLINGADAYAKSADGLTALALARTMGSEASVRRLAKHVELF